MSTLPKIQDAFQDRLLHGSDDILVHLGDDGARLLGAYDHAYVARLLDVMATDFEYVHTLLGDDDFEAAARAYLAAYPSRYRSIRWVGRDFPGWLATTEPWAELGMVSDMAAFEWALGLAFDAPDAPVLTADTLATIPPPAWGGMRFDGHPALSLVTMAWGVVAFRQALEDDTQPDGPPAAFTAPTTFAVWRDLGSGQVRYRDLAADEAAIASALVGGACFAELGDVAAATGDPEDAAVRVADYLRHWIEAGWIASLAEDGISR